MDSNRWCAAPLARIGGTAAGSVVAAMDAPVTSDSALKMAAGLDLRAGPLIKRTLVMVRLRCLRRAATIAGDA